MYHLICDEVLVIVRLVRNSSPNPFRFRIDQGLFVSLNVDNEKLRKEQKAVNAVLPTNATWHCSRPDLYRVKPSWVEGNLKRVRSHREDLSMSRTMVTKGWYTNCGIFELKRSYSCFPCVDPISIPSMFFGLGWHNHAKEADWNALIETSVNIFSNRRDSRSDRLPVLLTSPLLAPVLS
jgi:hypothetical protein